MTIRAFVIPSALICGECGSLLQNRTKELGYLRPMGQAVYECTNGSCSQYGQPHWYHFPEAYLDDKAITS